MSKEMEKALAEQPGGTRAEKIKSLQRNMLGAAAGADKAFMAELRDLIRETKGGARGGGGGGGMNPTDIEKVPGKRPMKMKKGGTVKASSASKRADGCAQRGKTKGRMV